MNYAGSLPVEKRAAAARMTAVRSGVPENHTGQTRSRRSLRAAANKNGPLSRHFSSRRNSRCAASSQIAGRSAVGRLLPKPHPAKPAINWEQFHGVKDGSLGSAGLRCFLGVAFFVNTSI